MPSTILVSRAFKERTAWHCPDELLDSPFFSDLVLKSSKLARIRGSRLPTSQCQALLQSSCRSLAPHLPLIADIFLVKTPRA